MESMRNSVRSQVAFRVRKILGRFCETVYDLKQLFVLETCQASLEREYSAIDANDIIYFKLDCRGGVNYSRVAECTCLSPEGEYSGVS